MHPENLKGAGEPHPVRIYAIGHSTHPIEHFIELPNPYGIKTVVNARTVPRSRHVPEFNWEGCLSGCPMIFGRTLFRERGPWK